MSDEPQSTAQPNRKAAPCPKREPLATAHAVAADLMAGDRADARADDSAASAITSASDAVAQQSADDGADGRAAVTVYASQMTAVTILTVLVVAPPGVSKRGRGDHRRGDASSGGEGENCLHHGLEYLLACKGR